MAFFSETLIRSCSCRDRSDPGAERNGWLGSDLEFLAVLSFAGRRWRNVRKNIEELRLARVIPSVCVAYVNIYVRGFCRAGRLGVFSPEKCFRRVVGPTPISFLIWKPEILTI